MWEVQIKDGHIYAALHATQIWQDGWKDLKKNSMLFDVPMIWR